MFCESPLAVLPHLQHLKVLSVCVGDENPRETRKFMNEFWRGMTDMNVELSEIIVNHVPDALVDYLQHYHGLEFFRFDTFDDHLLRAGIRGMFGTCVVELYCEGLPSHASTLKKVMIRTEYQDDWGWSPQIQPGLAKCSALEYLGIGVTFLQLLKSCPSEKTWTSESRRPIHLLIDCIVQECPSVRVLELYTQLTTRPGAYCKYIAQRMWGMFTESITSYVPPAEVISLPKIRTVQSYQNSYYPLNFVANAQGGRPLSYESVGGERCILNK
ncbi:hypothetical protein BJ165DRAFT_349400 [Panaeolus papilionaceus]|nr:hypothetical protein BJ165DRAFT_349400 [Panaeolus papilionaceus]